MTLHQPRGRRSRVRLVLLSVLGIVSAVALTQAPATAVTLPKPTSMTISVSTDSSITSWLANPATQQLPASTPGFLAAAGELFDVTVSLSADGAPAAFPNDQVVNLSASGPGVLTPSSATIPAGSSTVTFSTSYSQGSAALQLTAVVGKGRSALTALPTAPFRVENVLQKLPGNDPTLMAGTAGADGNSCAVVDKEHPVCGVLSLPQGANGGAVLTLGACPTGQPCSSGSLVTQLVADLSDGINPLYSRNSPATMTIICDKSVCGQGGVTKFTALWSQSATGDLQPAPACPSKGIVGPDQTYCTDYVSSTRDNAGDLHLVVRFLQDVRGTI